jgi:hypothetical protein
MDDTGAASRAKNAADFAADLRGLRLASGSPTLARLQSETGVSRSVISDAFAGKYLPSARTVAALVPVLGGDTTAWIARRDALAAGRDPGAAGVETASDEPATAEPVPVESVADAALDPTGSGSAPAEPVTPVATRGVRAGVRRRTVALIAAAAFVVGVALSGSTTALVLAHADAPAPAAPTAPAVADRMPRVLVVDGEDPAFTVCVDDAKVVAADSREADTLLEIVWSNNCYAGWGRITRYDGRAGGNTVSIAIYPETAPQGPSRQEAVEHDVQSAYTTLVVRPTPDTLLCAVGAYSVDGAQIDLGDPLCT